MLGLYGRLFAWGMAHADRGQKRLFGDRKRELFEEVKGSLLEIGPGTGVNLHYFPADIRWIGIEPNRHMHPYALEVARDLDIDVDLRRGWAEKLEIADDSIDVVVSTHVLCSVSDVAQSLREVRRVLRPGGRFHFLEHVAAEDGTALRHVQRALRPVWKPLGDGCRPDLETGVMIEGAGFREVRYERFDAPLPIVRPHIIGTATK